MFIYYVHECILDGIINPVVVELTTLDMTLRSNIVIYSPYQEMFQIKVLDFKEICQFPYMTNFSENL
jgi:hypothetical protein